MGTDVNVDGGTPGEQVVRSKDSAPSGAPLDELATEDAQIDPAPVDSLDEAQAVVEQAGVEPAVIEPAAASSHGTSPMPGFPSILLAALSAAAAAVHFALTPQHAAEWATEGLLFAITGWFQIAAAAWVLARPRSRAANVGILLVNLAALEAYLWSRTLGLPFGPLKGVIEEIGWIDGLTAGAEGLVIVLAAIRMSRLARAGSTVGRGRAAGIGLVTAALIAGGSAAVMASPAGQHGHGDASHSDAGATGSASARQSIFERGQRQAQLVAATEAAMKYPTVADAEREGLRRILGYAPGGGATYYDPEAAGGDLSAFDPAKPAAWIYSGNRPKSVVVGTMYLVDSADLPAGFVGSGDLWTQHSNVCVVTDSEGAVDLPLKIDSTVLASECKAEKGVLYENTPWMLRVWQVPGWQNPNGEFAHDHPDLICLDGRTSLQEVTDTCEGR